MPLIESSTSLTTNNASAGYQESFEQLLDRREVERAISLLENRSKKANSNLINYNTDTHRSMRRPNRPIYNKEGKFLRNKKVSRIAIPYQKFINEVALVFLYGKPVLWENATINPNSVERKQLQSQLDAIVDEQSQEYTTIKNRIAEIDASIDADDAKFHRLIDELHSARFDSCLRECKRYAGMEGCSAMLFHTYQQDGQAKMLIRVLAKSKKDDIFTLFDKYDRLIAFAWGYSTRDANGDPSKHYDIYTKNFIYYCTKNSKGSWTVEKSQNPIEKIPVIVFLQEVEWAGAETLIDRLEDAFCKNADLNDAFGSPALVATGEVTNTLPQQEEESKFYELRNGGDIRYLEPSNPSESRKDEIKLLESQIMEKTFTPRITLEDLKGLSNASGSTLRTVMLLATIKADRHKESHDGYLSRVGSLMKAIMGNVLDVRSGSYGNITLRHKFQEPFGADLSIILGDLLKQFGAGVISMQTFLEQSYLIPNAEKEIERIRREQQIAAEQHQQQMLSDVFAQAE